MNGDLRKKLRSGSLLADSSIVFGASLVANVFSYLFQVYIGRALGPVGYGVFGALVSLLYIISIPGNAISFTITKFVSEYAAKNHRDKISALMLGATIKLGKYALLVLALFIIGSGALAEFLKIPSSTPVIILGIVFSFGLITPVIQGVLQGLQKFLEIGAIGIASSVSKLAIGVALVYLGFGVNGALASIFFSGLLVFVLTLYVLREYAKPAKSQIEESVFEYSTPVLLTALLLAVISNIDVVLVKHYFSAEEAGYYAAASLFGKIVVFVSSPIATVLFPKASRESSSMSAARILRESILYTFALAFFTVLAYLLAPTFVVSLIFGSKFGSAAQLIGMFGIAMAFFALANVFITYDMAVRKMKFLYIVLCAALLEVAAILMFPTSLATIIKILILSMGFMLAALVLFNREELLGYAK